MRLKSAPDVRKSLREIAVKAIGTPGFSMAGGLAPGPRAHRVFHARAVGVARTARTSPRSRWTSRPGAVAILRYTVAHDCGRVINPMVVDGQVVGGVAHGVGNALFERMVYDENAQPLSTNFGEYLLPLATDVPRVTLVTPRNALAAESARHQGRGGRRHDTAIAAIIAAVENALAPFGVTIAEAPDHAAAHRGAAGRARLGNTRQKN